MKILPIILFLIIISTITVYDFGIGWYRIEKKYDINGGTFGVKMYVWHNADIIYSNHDYWWNTNIPGVQKDSMDKVLDDIANYQIQEYKKNFNE